MVGYAACNDAPRCNPPAAPLVRKSPPHEQLFALLAGRSCMDSARAALRASPDMMKVLAGLRANINDTLFQDAWNRGLDLCLDRQGRTLAALRAAVSAFVANPDAAPQAVNTPFGKITVSSVAEEAMNARRLVASIKVGSETLSLNLGVSPAEIVARLDGQIAAGAELLGRKRLGEMLAYAKKHGAVGEDGDPCLGRTVAQAILRQFASAAPLQAYVNEVCNLDPKAQIASEYDKMSPAQITESLSGKTLDDILDDPVTNSTRPGMLSFQKKVLSTYFTTVSHERKAGVLSSARPSSPARTTTSSARSWPKPPTGSSAPSPTASSRSTWPSTKSSTRRRPATTTSRPRRPPKSSPTSSARTSTPSRSPSRASSARAGSPSPSRTPRRTT